MRLCPPILRPGFICQSSSNESKVSPIDWEFRTLAVCLAPCSCLSWGVWQEGRRKRETDVRAELGEEPVEDSQSSCCTERSASIAVMLMSLTWDKKQKNQNFSQWWSLGNCPFSFIGRVKAAHGLSKAGGKRSAVLAFPTLFIPNFYLFLSQSSLLYPGTQKGSQVLWSESAHKKLASFWQSSLHYSHLKGSVMVEWAQGCVHKRVHLCPYPVSRMALCHLQWH